MLHSKLAVLQPASLKIFNSSTTKRCCRHAIVTLQQKVIYKLWKCVVLDGLNITYFFPFILMISVQEKLHDHQQDLLALCLSTNVFIVVLQFAIFRICKFFYKLISF
jgi:hypothetical protein